MVSCGGCLGCLEWSEEILDLSSAGVYTRSDLEGRGGGNGDIDIEVTLAECAW